MNKNKGNTAAAEAFSGFHADDRDWRQIVCTLFRRAFRAADHASPLSIKDNEHLRNVTQTTSLNLDSELCHDENGFQCLAEQVPRHDFVPDAEICHNSRQGMISQRRRNQSLPCLTSPFFFPLLNCSNVQLFKCFLTSSFPVPCSSVLTFRVKTKIFTLIELLITNTCQIYIYSKG